MRMFSLFVVLGCSFLLALTAAADEWDTQIAKKTAFLQSFQSTSASSEGQSSACFAKYDRLYYRDDILNITLGFGYVDYPDQNYVLDSYAASALIRALTAPCARGVLACGFRRDPHDADYFRKTVIGPRGDRRLVQIHMLKGSLSGDRGLNSSPAHLEEQLRKCHTVTKRFFDEIAQGPEVVMYTGHSRDGGGPDFCPEVLTKDRNHVDYAFYRRQRAGEKSMVEALRASVVAKKPVEVLGMYSCDSRLHFYKYFSAADQKAGLILTLREMEYGEDIQELYASIDSLLAQRCADGFSKVLGAHTKPYRLFTGR